MRKQRMWWLLGLVSIIAMGCATVNIYVTFPAEEVKKAAIDIESEVDEGTPGGNAKPKKEPTSPGKEGKEKKKGSMLFLDFFSSTAYAGEITPQVKVKTPEVQEAIDSRKARLPKIKEFKKEGCIGENNKGLIELRPTDKTRNDKDYADEVKAVVKGENKDRDFIYKTLVEQNNMDPNDIETVREQFAAVHREKAEDEHWIQLPDGKWLQKKDLEEVE